MKEKKIPCEVYSRIVGYLRPVQNWHKGKQQEYKNRKEYDTGMTVKEAEKEALFH